MEQYPGAIDESIVRFIREHHVLTLATCAGGDPWCSNMFYAWLDEGMFVFSSSSETKHVADAGLNSTVAGSVVLETKVVGDVRGIQFCGRMFRPARELYDRAQKRYLKKFPYAVAMKLDIWVIEPDFIKLTDNRLGFGKKTVWKRG